MMFEAEPRPWMCPRAAMPQGGGEWVLPASFQLPPGCAPHGASTFPWINTEECVSLSGGC